VDVLSIVEMICLRLTVSYCRLLLTDSSYGCSQVQSTGNTDTHLFTSIKCTFMIGKLST